MRLPGRHQGGRWVAALGVVGALLACGCGRTELDGGDVLLSQGKPAEALEFWQKALATRPGDTTLLLRIATAESRLKRNDAAAATLGHAIELEPGSAKLRHNLGLVRLKQKRFDDALAAFRQALELEEGYPETNYYMGLIHEMRGHERAAERFYVKDVNNGPSAAWDRLTLLTREKRAAGVLPRSPRPGQIVAFSLALLALAACLYGLRLYLELRRDAQIDLSED